MHDGKESRYGTHSTAETETAKISAAIPYYSVIDYDMS